MCLLEVKEVSKYYGTYTALDKVDICIPKGSIYGLLGPNGAGKTSLIRIINQITAPDSGAVFFDGKPLAPKHIAHIGYLPEERGLYPKMKVGEQLMYLAQLKGLEKSEAKERIKHWFERMDIGGWWNKKIEELSKGMAQKVQFVSTVLHNPQLLIFDEPFTGFDPINTNLIKDEIRRLAAEGATIIFSTHRMESVEEICEEITLINKGKIIVQGNLAEVKNQFRTGIFHTELVTEKSIDHFESAELLKTEMKNWTQQLTLRLKETATNKVLQELNGLGTIRSFAESIPSLNDIFIQKVGEDE